MSLLTVDELAALLKVSRATVYAWVKQAKIEPMRIGRSMLFDEDAVMVKLGRLPSAAVYLIHESLEEAKLTVRQYMVRWTTPAFTIEYLTSPTADFIRARVLDPDGHPGPGGVRWDSLTAAKARGDYVFVGGPESVWRIHQFRKETSGAGVDFIALELVPAERAGSKVDALLEAMREGIFARVPEWTREEAHERRPR